MSNNRSSNRRRGRGGNRPQGAGQINRIDSRARGNAPQLLEKYRKLAHDAALNGDRVQSEYYLQFADHYFRVIADSRAQKEESRMRRDAGRDQQDDEDPFEDEPDRGFAQDRTRRDRFIPEEGGRGSEEDDADLIEAPGNGSPPEGRGGRSRRARRSEDARRDEEGAREGGEEAGFDASILPPAIGGGDGQEEAEEEARPRRPRRPRPRGSEDESLEAVG